MDEEALEKLAQEEFDKSDLKQRMGPEDPGMAFIVAQKTWKQAWVAGWKRAWEAKEALTVKEWETQA